MKNFNFKRGGGSDRFGGGGRFNKGGIDREMHRTTCSKCGKSCEVPFKPVNGKPVFCKDCFAAEGGPATSNDRFSRKEFSPRSAPRSNGGDFKDNKNNEVLRKIEELSSKIDKLTKIVEDLV